MIEIRFDEIVILNSIQNLHGYRAQTVRSLDPLTLVPRGRDDVRNVLRMSMSGLIEPMTHTGGISLR